MGITNKGNKGQMIGQVFIFILAGLIFILIITYGYRAIQHFMERQEQVLLLDFRTDLEIATEGVRRDYGSVRKLELNLPSEYLGFCMFEFGKCGSANPKLIHPSRTMSLDWARQACEVKSANAFIVPRSMDMTFENIEIGGPGYFCIANTGTITLRLEGTGRKAKVSPWG